MRKPVNKRTGKVEYHQGAPLGMVINEFLAAYGLSQHFAEARVEACWESLMGAAVARNTRKIILKDGCLHVMVESSALRYELKMGEFQLCEKLNSLLGGPFVKQIKVG